MKHRFLAAMSTDPRFDTIKRERVSDRIAQNLLKLIASGELAPGERLPGERQLADMMGVSRVSVRAALQELKAQGFLSAVQGGGTRVVSAAGELIGKRLGRLVQANERNLLDLIEIRSNLEVWAARLAAENADEEQLAEIERVLLMMADEMRPKRLKAEDDLAFHMAIAKASGSAVYLHLMSALTSILEEQLTDTRLLRYNTPEQDAKFLEQHWAIFRAISAHDAEAAGRAMEQHLRSVQACYEGENDYLKVPA